VDIAVRPIPFILALCKTTKKEPRLNGPQKVHRARAHVCVGGPGNRTQDFFAYFAKQPLDK